MHLIGMEMNMAFLGVWAGRAIPIVIGGAVGYAYHRFVGCKTGTCPITRNPWISTIYGAVMGGMLFS